MKFSNHIRGDRNDYLRGLEQRLLDNPREDRPEGEEVLPFPINGSTYLRPQEMEWKPYPGYGRNKVWYCSW